MTIADYLGTVAYHYRIRVACTKPLDKLRTLNLRFDDGAGRAASKLFHLMLNDSQQSTDATIYGLRRFFFIPWPLGWSFLPQKLLLSMCPDIWEHATLPKYATIYDCLYKACADLVVPKSLMQDLCRAGRAEMLTEASGVTLWQRILVAATFFNAHGDKEALQSLGSDCDAVFWRTFDVQPMVYSALLVHHNAWMTECRRLFNLPTKKLRETVYLQFLGLLD
ncbi:hypothetical protein D6D01_08507 [Aureobasidium pullulans]|uniref:Uncharacterized protein n=1 Tax=Aureobasidium pullulans TaxID=5580 RepID=A0A4S9KCZ8_AURPU|nr:hypothetical protein D6D01_08507 [Aureobasidium pullulans]